MNVEEQISAYIDSQPEAKRQDMETLRKLMVEILPQGKVWFDEGKDASGKVVTNPTAGYGSYTIKYANGTSREFFQIGVSANTSGISVYAMGIPDKTYLPNTFGKDIGKAMVTGYCIKFKKLSDINIDILEAALRYGIAATSEN